MLRREEKEGRGPGGSLAHQEVTGSVSLAGGRPVAANFAVAARRSYGETAMIGGDSGLPGAIPLTETKEAMRRS
jgi:hypothetical protein